MNWTLIGILFVTSLVCCSMGFKRFVWFMSIGYGFAIAGIAAVLMVYAAMHQALTLAYALALIVALIYGLRLGLFLYVRESRNKAYKKILATKVGNEPPVFVKVMMWLAMGVIYLCEMAGLIFRMNDPKGSMAALWIGIVIMVIGCVMEALADQQKSAQKKSHPNLPAMKGLYALVRCPNYLGEILFWIGVFVSGIGIYQGWLQWTIAVSGLVMIVFIMVDGAKRMEKGHNQRYGSNPDYQIYADSTPILFPFVPLYHLNKKEA